MFVFNVFLKTYAEKYFQILYYCKTDRLCHLGKEVECLEKKYAWMRYVKR